MNERTDEHDRLIEAAMTAALKVLADKDPATAEALWQQLAVEIFTDQMLRLGGC